MRVLYLTNGFPYPLTSGYLRHYYLIRELSRRHTVTLVSIAGPGLAEEHVAALEPFTERILTFASTTKGGSLGRKTLSRARSLVSADQGDKAVGDMRAAVEHLVREQLFDVVLFSGKRTFLATESIDLPLVADMCDATSMRIRGAMQYAKPSRLPVLWLDYLQVRHVERKLIGRATHLLFASTRDREVLLGGGRNHATVVPNGVNLEFWRRSSGERGRDTIVFTGAMHYPPNADAALYLVEQILPLVRRTVPNVQLMIVGRDPRPKLVQAAREGGAIVTGFVDDVRPYLERATVFAAPLRFGAGIQNKVLEAMAMELPVVASPLAADGLRTEEGKNPPVQVAHHREQFAELIGQKLVDWASAPVPFSEARHFVQENFVWERSAEKLEQVIKNAVGGSGRRLTS